MTAAPVTVSWPAEHVAVITLDHPPQNALDQPTRLGLIHALDQLNADLQARAVVLTSTGTTFCAGAELPETRRVAAGAAAARQYLQEFDDIVLALEASRAPIVAAINGPALGGGLDVALACDIRVAADSAFFVAAGVNVGLIANFWRLTRTIGLGPATEMVLTGDRYTCDHALRWGLVTEAHPAEDVVAAALRKASRIASRAPLAVEKAKTAIRQAPTLDRDTMMAVQGQHFLELAASADHAEALAAFLAKRHPVFTRR